MSFSSLEELIETENPVRFIDAFVDHPFLNFLVAKINAAQVQKHLGQEEGICLKQLERPKSHKMESFKVTLGFEFKVQDI